METPIRSLLRGEPPTPISPTAPVADALALMRKKGWGSVVVADRHEVVGIFTEKDYLMRVCAPNRDIHDTTLADVMTPAPDVLNTDTDIAYAVNMMAVGSLRSIPIIDQTGRLAAVFTAADVMSHLGRVFGAEDRPLAEMAAPGEWVDIGGEG